MKVTITFETTDLALIDDLYIASQHGEGITISTGGGRNYIDPFTFSLGGNL